MGGFGRYALCLTLAFAACSRTPLDLGDSERGGMGGGERETESESGGERESVGSDGSDGSDPDGGTSDSGESNGSEDTAETESSSATESASETTGVDSTDSTDSSFSSDSLDSSISSDSSVFYDTSYSSDSSYPSDSTDSFDSTDTTDTTDTTDSSLPDTDSDTGGDPQCSLSDDFTPCHLVTSPDRSYDICVRGVCVSPGCGDASCNAPGPHFPSPDTSQRACYDEKGEMTCPTSGEAYFGQDAQYGPDLDSSSATRFDSGVSIAEQPVVHDNVTGLSWQGCARGLDGDACERGRAVTSDWDDALSYCDDLSWGGDDDWRLPDEFELFSIVDFGTSSPSIDEAAFQATPADYFWTSSSGAYLSSYATAVQFSHGEAAGYVKASRAHVRCVRGGPADARRLTASIRSGDRVVEDDLLSLAWQGCARGLAGETCAEGAAEASTWQEALSFCEELSWGGHADWRLPNVKELLGIQDNSVESPSIDPVFPSTPPKSFWSSTSHDRHPSRAWSLSFDGVSVSSARKTESLLVRCVRDSSPDTDTDTDTAPDMDAGAGFDMDAGLASD